MKFLGLAAAPVLAALVLAAVPNPAAAQANGTSMTAVPRSNPVRVNLCNPQRGMVTNAFAPAFYPPGPFYWGDAYGVRYYQPPVVTSNPTLSIDYKNVSAKTMKSIEFGLIARGSLVAEVRDVGTFSPGVEIKHLFGLNPNVFPIGTGLPKCLALRVTYADGTKWKNPRLPALRRGIYGPGPGTH